MDYFVAWNAFYFVWITKFKYNGDTFNKGFKTFFNIYTIFNRGFMVEKIVFFAEFLD